CPSACPPFSLILLSPLPLGQEPEHRVPKFRTAAVRETIRVSDDLCVGAQLESVVCGWVEDDAARSPHDFADKRNVCLNPILRGFEQHRVVYGRYQTQPMPCAPDVSQPKHVSAS